MMQHEEAHRQYLKREAVREAEERQRTAALFGPTSIPNRDYELDALLVDIRSRADAGRKASSAAGRKAKTSDPVAAGFDEIAVLAKQLHTRLDGLDQLRHPPA